MSGYAALGLKLRGKAKHPRHVTEIVIKTKKLESQVAKMLEIVVCQVLEQAVFRGCLFTAFLVGKQVKIQSFSSTEAVCWQGSGVSPCPEPLASSCACKLPSVPLSHPAMPWQRRMFLSFFAMLRHLILGTTDVTESSVIRSPNCSDTFSFVHFI